jgi:carbonic anhydrase
MRAPQTKIIFALAAALGMSVATAAQWEPVTVKGDRIELDKSRIARTKDGKTTAWSRVALDRDMIDEYGMRYTAIEALNRYDCAQHSFATLKRVYRRDGKLVREEAVSGVRELAAEAGSVDEKLLVEACKPRTVGEAQRIAETAATAAAVNLAKPSVMYADMRSAETTPKSKLQQVADKQADAKPADAKAATATDKPAEPKPERPHFIELPKIDKTQFEDPAKTAVKPAEAAPADPRASAAKPGMAAEKPAIARSDLERLYATSGPRKVAKKKAVEPAVVEHHDIHWSYEGEGAPANWSKLRPDYGTCATGKRQSPIDIREGIIKVDLEPIKFNYKPTQFRITDNGHTIQVDVGEGNTIKVMGREFQLVQFHFHRPSEERINGKSFDMVVHLVHKDDDGKLAVIAVLLQKGSEHPLIQTLWNNMPLERGQSLEPAVAIDLNQLLPPAENRAYYTYMGSLTTPPCSEDVLWMVMKQPVQVSPQQVSIFARLYSNNARPVQPANDRLIKETR